ncbi:uncharacterized protein LOC113498778 [Trichoplusia ni]|uniref:Uncharacterized protein LOC113498778 n=1 Tax=Trichoplusia ni TaxID=7111 RepID=A0A7E5W258_TRINI|nr:uncharacterized protein LOC113498778 [Trichoplusia ni]
MNKNNKKSVEMVATKNKNKVVVPCSTPEHRQDSPSRDSDSLCDSEAASPVPFFCTQDGAEGETDVVWNFYTPKSEQAQKSRFKNSTPVSRKSKRVIKPKIIEKLPPRRRPLKPTHKKTALFQELIELNQNLHELMTQNPQNLATEKLNSGSEDDIFNESPEFSPKSRVRSNSRCLRRNVLSSNFVKTDPETALESDDSMNECLIKASQVVEENILNEAPAVKKPCYERNYKNKLFTSDINFKMDQDSMDAILNSIKLDSPMVYKAKQISSPQMNNDSFDSLVGNLNDSTLEKLTQMPAKMDTSKRKSRLNESRSDGNNWTIKELIVHESSPSSKSIFSRHNSMPVSPSVTNQGKPSTSGMAFGRYNSMPFRKDADATIVPGDSPIRCTPEEIKKKHQLAREKLLAKRLLPFTVTQNSSQSSNSANSTQMTQQPISKIIEKQFEHKRDLEPLVPKKVQFQPKVASSAATMKNKLNTVNSDPKPTNSSEDLKLLIEKKRQEALMKLRRRQIQSKIV